MRLDAFGGFVFDLDGTLIHRTATGFEAEPGAREVIEAIRASGRRFAIFTNASHAAPSGLGAELRADGLPVADDEVLTPICSAITYLTRHHAGRPVATFATAAARERLAAAGVVLVEGDDVEHAEVVFVAHPDAADLGVLDHAARAITRGAPLLTSSYVAGYAGANGIIFSRGAMLAAALHKVTGRRPKVVGKPSRAAVGEAEERLGLHGAEIVMVGDDAGMDIALGRIGGWHTILVRSGISGTLDPEKLPLSRRPHESVDGVAQLLDRL
jgi:HAD superfamily hydrolase (TIGR01450 family)